MKNIKRNKGITLIALIITIIIMLILAGVTINIAINGGLFTQAQTAVEETKRKAYEEQVEIIGVTARLHWETNKRNNPTLDFDSSITYALTGTNLARSGKVVGNKIYLHDLTNTETLNYGWINKANYKVGFDGSGGGDSEEFDWRCLTVHFRVHRRRGDILPNSPIQ